MNRSWTIFSFTFTVSEDERENIPAAGKVVVIANHPIGSLDGLALLKLIYHVRPDVKIVANDLLMAIEPLKSLLLPIRNMTGTSQKHQIQRINAALDQDAAIIFFPSGEVSRLGLKGIKDGHLAAGLFETGRTRQGPDPADSYRRSQLNILLPRLNGGKTALYHHACRPDVSAA